MIDVEAGIVSALERGMIGLDAVKHLVLCRIERRPPRLDMIVYPYLPKAYVAATSAGDYMALLSGGRSWRGHEQDATAFLPANHLKSLRLPTFLREHDKVAKQCAAEGIDHSRYLLRLAELELIDSERRMVDGEMAD
ncbi:IS21 family transposase [Ahrensia sp. R2A130]|nr:IS21 family transposase [Ahrensia sp. R2A130]